MNYPPMTPLEFGKQTLRMFSADPNRMMTFKGLLDRMRHAQPSRALDRAVHKMVGGKFAFLAPRYTSDFEAAYSILRKADVTMLSLEGSWEPYRPEAHPAWVVRYYTKERPPTEGDKGGWYDSIAAGVSPAIALCRAALVVLARVQGTWITIAD